MLLLSMWRFLDWTIVVPGSGRASPAATPSRLGPSGGSGASEASLQAAGSGVNGAGGGGGGQDTAGAAPAAPGVRRRWLPRVWRRSGAEQAI